ncbi:unnamed protein product, partial [marine sediment metagenome]
HWDESYIEFYINDGNNTDYFTNLRNNPKILNF